MKHPSKLFRAGLNVIFINELNKMELNAMEDYLQEEGIDRCTYKDFNHDGCLLAQKKVKEVLEETAKAKEGGYPYVCIVRTDYPVTEISMPMIDIIDAAHVTVNYSPRKGGYECFKHRDERKEAYEHEVYGREELV